MILWSKRQTFFSQKEIASELTAPTALCMITQGAAKKFTEFYCNSLIPQFNLFVYYYYIWTQNGAQLPLLDLRNHVMSNTKRK